MNEVMELICEEIRKTKYGVIKLELTLHDGQIRCVNVTTTQRHNITPTQVKDINHARNRKD